MDKQKTGEMIKQARFEKGYTQTQLGDLVGVSNKAVSRWENGESFPDIGVLENLSNILGLKIQDIVVGKRENEDVDAIVEVVRFARFQQKADRKRCLIRVVQTALFIVLLGIAYFGFRGYGLWWQYLNVYYYVLPLFLVAVLWLCAQDREGRGLGKYDKWQIVISLGSFIYIVLMMWYAMSFYGQEGTWLHMQEKYTGVVFHSQLVLVFLGNMVILFMSDLKGRGDSFSISLKTCTTITVMHLTIIYGELLHSLLTVQESFRLFIVSTVVHLFELGIALIIAWFLRMRKHQSGHFSASS